MISYDKEFRIIMIRKIRIFCFYISIICLISIPAWANVNVPPTPDGKALPVYITLGIIDIYDINDNKQNLSLGIIGKIRWKDPRLAHEGPGSIKRRLEEIWYPYISFSSLLHSWTPILRFAEVMPDGEVVYRINTRGEFSQSLNLHKYPFDRQVIRIPIVSEYSDEDVVLLPDPEEPSFIAEKFTVADWEIKNFGIRSIESQVNRFDLSSRFEVYFEADRRSEFIILTFIIPLALIVGMSWIVFWINPSEIRSQFSVSVTTVLTLIAYYISLTSRLPEIPYLTRMDIFVFGSTILVFASLLEVVVTSHLAGTGRLNIGRRIDAKCRWLFPLSFALVVFFSFLS